MPDTTNYPVINQKAPTFYFIGVTTTQSSIMRVFPLWTKELGRPEVVIQGVDIEPNADPEIYRRAVAQIKYDPLSLGGLVTTHKISLLDAARDMFDYLDEYAKICSEVSSISKRNGRLEGHAKDPITAGLSLDAVLGADYFARTGGHVFCIGSGGSAVAISLHLIKKANPGDRPRRFIITGRTPRSVDHLEKVVRQFDTDIEFVFHCHEDPRRNDEIMAQLPNGSIVINATGMGKDRPGSPITGDGLFPRNAIAWELNYRGELDFMHQALAQRESRGVKVEDGWLYFIHGWTQVIAQVYGIDIEADMLARLSDIAQSVRGR
jgi:shikimate dehydrogenase